MMRELPFVRGAAPGLADWSASLAGVQRLPRGVIDDVERARALARRFNDEVVRPAALALDAAVQDDPTHLPQDFIRQASAWRLYSRWLPRLVGGEGWSFLSLYAFLEEVSACCVGLANVIGVHYLGAATLMATWNMRLVQEIFRDVAEGDRCGAPRLISLAITEPNAGTDMEETVLIDRARIGTVAEPLPDGGYRLNGRKVFISNGHVSRWHMVVTNEDRRSPADTGVVLVLRTGDAGFAFGRQENKMGQKACVASELVFTDCRVAPERVAFCPRDSVAMGAVHREMVQLVIDYVVSSTRAGVGAFAAGVAWGSYRTALDYARLRVLPAGRLIEQQWAQSLLAEMAKNAQLAREAWVESACANSLGGLYPLMLSTPVMQLDKHGPGPLVRLAGTALRHEAATRLMRDRYMKRYRPDWQDNVSGLASMAKFACSDLGIENAGLALELMGADGLRHGGGAEKFLRDAKLLQIYEGTNQLNRINYFKCSLRPDADVRVFLREKRP